jgi:cysteine synthase A
MRIGPGSEFTMLPHIIDAIQTPALIEVAPHLYALRFEVLKACCANKAVQGLLQAGRIQVGDTLLDSSSGIYALSLALACHKYGLHCHIVASQAADKTLLMQLEILGARVDKMPPDPDGKFDQEKRIARIEQLLAANPGIHWMQQYHDEIHYAGYRRIAAILADAFDPGTLSVVGSVGSGCSSGGLVEPLRGANPSIELVGVQPFGSVTFGSEHIADPGMLSAGLGTSIRFRNVKHHLYDRMHWVSYRYACAATIALLRRHAIFAGLSSGCAFLAARFEAQRQPARNVVFICADTGHRYVEQVFAHHADTPEIGEFMPLEVDSPARIEMPWSTMPWNRRALADEGR